MSRYFPEIFDAADEAAARAIILTPEGDTTEGRWARETPYVAERFAQLLKVRASHTVVDFGCGIGRVAKMLIEDTGCSVLGVDISPRMRELALTYVASPRFRVASLEQFDAMRESGWRADSAYTCWVLQHCMDPHQEVVRIAGALHPAAPIAVLNNSRFQVIPTDAGWAFHDTDLRAMLCGMLTETSVEKLAADSAAPEVVADSFLGVYITRPDRASGSGAWARLKQRLRGR
ncbi:MAG: hypothetical protein JWN73_4238 [Betaproteobacteria bacterium]|nr:hypothetical protein [Betaproteobacteria bacterium]